MPTIKADLGLCQGYANCVIAAGDLFDIDDEGKVVVLSVRIPGAERARAEDAARACPISALSIEDD